MIDENLLGRYEFVGTTDKGNRSAKFWHIVYDKTEQNYIATYGSLNTSGRPHDYGHDPEKVRKVIRGKLNKGYRKVAGYNETTGANSLHFIKTA